MTKVSRLPVQSAVTTPPQNRRSDDFASTIKHLFTELPLAEKERVLAQLTEILRPIPAPRAGDVLNAVIHLLPRRTEWTVQELKSAICENQIEATDKEIYNALGYLTRKQKIQRVGHGRYMVDGVLVETVDDIGVGPPTRHEIDDT
jgi:hypothetical protein